jgi:hypothetical protein
MQFMLGKSRFWVLVYVNTWDARNTDIDPNPNTDTDTDTDTDTNSELANRASYTS